MVQHGRHLWTTYNEETKCLPVKQGNNMQSTSFVLSLPGKGIQLKKNIKIN